MRSHLLYSGLIILGLASLASAFVLTEDGIYAVFDASAGEITVELDYDQVPITVGNFVGLAAGTKAYFDKLTGEISQAPFYDGITFHRVVTNFVIQAGSPNGQGTDGPGYSFADEFVDGLTHEAEGVLSMANSGVNTNGSQFFITLRATPELDDLHTVFGRIVEGIEIVRLIGSVSRSPDDVNPPEAAVINSAEIVRSGAAALAWDESVVSLPEVYSDSIRVTFPGDGTPLIHMNRPASAQAWLYSSTDLFNWTRLAAWNPLTVADPDFTAGLAPGNYPVDTIRYLRRVDVFYPQ
tara:strand:- start:1318 stop:2202 length:885 start_codon:yes stop_codon:yes gene_type:complete